MMNRNSLLYMRIHCRAALLLACTVIIAQQARAQGPQPITPAMEQRVDGMLRKLTLEEKIALLAATMAWPSARSEYRSAPAQDVGWSDGCALLGILDSLCGRY